MEKWSERNRQGGHRGRPSGRRAADCGGVPVVNKIARLREDQVAAVEAMPSVPRVPGFSAKLRRVVDAGLNFLLASVDSGDDQEDKQ